MDCLCRLYVWLVPFPWAFKNTWFQKHVVLRTRGFKNTWFQWHEQPA